MVYKITSDDAAYPENLRTIYNPPKVLYINGLLEARDDAAVAIVGSRRASGYGLETSERLAYELAVRGVTIVSGMARGIDSAAHRGALRAKGRTIAVLGSGHNDIYPPENEELYHEISLHGAVISEFEDDVPPLPRNFPMRNRIISGLSLGVVIVEAARNSGALITADYALEQGREVFAVPGKISSVTSSGAHGLIKDGAKLVQSADDILEELSLHEIEPVAAGEKGEMEDKVAQKTRVYVYNSLTIDERKVYKALADEPLSIDEVLEKTLLEHTKATKVLLNLRLKKLIKELPGKQFIRT